MPAAVRRRALAEQGFLGGLALDALVGDGADRSVATPRSPTALLVAVTERRTARRDRCLRGRASTRRSARERPDARQSGSGRSGVQRPAARPGGRAHPLRALAAGSARAGSCGPRAFPSGRRGVGARRPPAAATPLPWPRSPSAIWWGTSPGSATGSSRWISGRTRSGRAR